MSTLDMQDTASLVELDYDIMHIYLQGWRLICACREPRLAVFETNLSSQIREDAVYPDTIHAYSRSVSLRRHAVNAMSNSL